MADLKMQENGKNISHRQVILQTLLGKNEAHRVGLFIVRLLGCSFGCVADCHWKQKKGS